jgi:type 1 glutamine amidotransferase
MTPVKILLVSAGVFHPPLLGRYRLRRFFDSLHGFSFEAIGSLESLPKLDLANFRALVLYYHRARISSTALEALEGFVSSGGGALAIHSATASFKDAMRYFDILGGRFIGHGPVDRIEIKPAASQETAFAGIPAFQVYDELYLHELRGPVQVQFYASHEGEQAPMVWTHRFGQGRVCYACPGHTSSSLVNPRYQQILARGLTWACRKGEDNI